ncbi:MAG: hypothetical protein S4CHLAM2_03220 [Chlamydiales bacterium]|nr:hypothetical protein [Chlamydiales bacterium]
MERQAWLKRVDSAFKVHPVVALLGPRQCGKTTLSQQYTRQHSIPPQNHFDLENPNDLARLRDPVLTLSKLSGLIIIDEIQRIPDLFPALRVLVDRRELKQRYLILGSASRDLIRQSSETLAGRIGYLELTPFSLQEAPAQTKLWLRGGYPRSYLADNESISADWRKAFIRTYLERDIPSLGIDIPSENLRRFWMMLAHYHGSIFNASELGRSLGFTHKTIQRYADILAGTFMIRQLRPWFENLGKRQVKSSKIYLRDSGVLHTLAGINNQEELLVHPKLGSSWEGFALEEVIRFHQAESEECYFWATHQQAELDLLICKNGKRSGFEFKYSGSPKLTRSMQIALHDLKLDSLTVIYPGKVDYPLSEAIDVIGLESYLFESDL